MRRAPALAATALVASVALGIAATGAGGSTNEAEGTDRSSAGARPRGQSPTPATDTVTADQLGADAVIAVIGRGGSGWTDPVDLAPSLEVITADGVRHAVYSLAPRATTPGAQPRDTFTLADWRPEMHTALLRVSRGQVRDGAVAYDVVTGASREVTLPKRAISVGLNPDGTGVVMTTYADERRPGTIWTLTWEGVRTRLPGSSGGAAITSTDGKTTVTGAAHSRQWWVIDLAARTGSQLDPPGSCDFIRWLDADSVLSSCYKRGVNQLRSVNLDGTSVPLGVRHRVRGRGIFLDGDVREVQGRSWFESFDDCDDLLTEQPASGRVRRVEVPGLEASLSLVGVRGDELLITHYWPAYTAEECGTPRIRPALARFDPVTGAETILTRLGWREDWIRTLPATEVQEWKR